MRKITLLISGAFALAMSANVFAAEQKAEEEGPLSEQPIDIKKYIISFITGEKDFITAAKNAEAFSRVNTEYRPLVIEELKSRLKKPEEAQAELFELIEKRPEELNAFVLMILFEAGASFNEQDRYGNTVLMWAIEGGVTDIAKMFIEKIAKTAKKDAVLNMQNNLGNTALMKAVLQKNKEIVKMLIDNGADVNMKNKFGNTALIWAAVKGYEEIVRMLIDNGADLNMRNDSGETALDKAAQRGHEEIAAIIEEAIKNQKPK